MDRFSLAQLMDPDRALSDALKQAGRRMLEQAEGNQVSRFQSAL